MYRASRTFALLLTVILAACDSGGGGEPIDDDSPEIEGSMTAEVAGRAFEADSLVEARMIGTTLVVEGADSTGRVIRLALLDAERGTHVIGRLTDSRAQASYANITEEYESVSDTTGTLELTRLDSLAVRGTFSFVGERLGGTRIVISGGEFLAPWADAP